MALSELYKDVRKRIGPHVQLWRSSCGGKRNSCSRPERQKQALVVKGR